MGTARIAETVNWELVERFREALAARIALRRLLLFGSRARGASSEWSDYDFIVVAPDFARVSPLWRGQGFDALWFELGGQVDVDLLCLTPDEFAAAASRPTSWISAAAAEAIEIHRDRDALGGVLV